MGKTPIDTTVTDASSAINHEWNVHLNPAINSVDGEIRNLEAKQFKSEEECQKAVAKTEKSVHSRFNLSLQESQKEENNSQ